jgi:hypothetical protein
MGKVAFFLQLFINNLLIFMNESGELTSTSFSVNKRKLSSIFLLNPTQTIAKARQSAGLESGLDSFCDISYISVAKLPGINLANITTNPALQKFGLLRLNR